MLQQEVLQAQSAQIDLIGGATYTSESYAQSLQSALDKARRLAADSRMAPMRRVGRAVGHGHQHRRARRRRRARRSTRAVAWFARVDDLFSTWRADTEIMRIARGELAVDDADPEVRDGARRSASRCGSNRTARSTSRSARNAAVPARPGLAPLDPSGLVKGWAVARAGDHAAAPRARRTFFVNAGGDVLTRGCPDANARAGGSGIQHPWERDRVAAVLVAHRRRGRDLGPLRARRPRRRSPYRPRPRPASPRSRSSDPTSPSPTRTPPRPSCSGPTTGCGGSRPGSATRRWASPTTTRVLLTPGFDRYRVS